MDVTDFQLRFLGDLRLAPHATSASPAWLWSTDGEHVLWANPVAAKHSARPMRPISPNGYSVPPMRIGGKWRSSRHGCRRTARCAWSGCAASELRSVNS